MTKNSLKVLWQISVITSAEAEDAVAVLLENIFSTPASIFSDAETQQTTATVYLEKSPSAATRKSLQAIPQHLRASGINPAPAKITVKKLPRENWAESWKRHFKPIEIGRMLLIKPSWSRQQAKKNQAVVILDPGLSFGTGQHATTSFCLNQLCAARRAGEPQSFLDIGTGSGILAIAAAKLGYSPIHAFDFDPEAVRVSHANAKRNRVAEKIHLRQQDLTKLPRRSQEKFDVICANLIFDLLLSQAGKIGQRLKPDGRLILAGILHSQFAQVESSYKKIGFKLIHSRLEKEWQSGEFIFEIF